MPTTTLTPDILTFAFAATSAHAFGLASILPCDPSGFADHLNDANEGDVPTLDAIMCGMTLGLALANAITSGVNPADIGALEMSAAGFAADLAGMMDSIPDL